MRSVNRWIYPSPEPNPERLRRVWDNGQRIAVAGRQGRGAHWRSRSQGGVLSFWSRTIVT